MKLVPVVSDNIAGIGYDPNKNTLKVAFKRGADYTFADVPPEVHQALMAADSKGAYFAANIRGKFAYKKVN